MAVTIAERVSQAAYHQWAKRLRLMGLEPYSLAFKASCCKCGDFDCVKTRIYIEDEPQLVLFAMAKDGESRHYAALDTLREQWKVYKEVERVLSALETAGELD